MELPELNNGPHFFYGLQWWFFGVLAVFGFCYLAFDEWRSGRRDEEPAEAGALTGRKQKRAEKNAHKQAVRAAYQRAYESERRERDQSARSMPPSTGSIAPETNDDGGRQQERRHPAELLRLAVAAQRDRRGSRPREPHPRRRSTRRARPPARSRPGRAAAR